MASLVDDFELFSKPNWLVALYYLTFGSIFELEYSWVVLLCTVFHFLIKNITIGGFFYIHNGFFLYKEVLFFFFLIHELPLGYSPFLRWGITECRMLMGFRSILCKHLEWKKKMKKKNGFPLVFPIIDWLSRLLDVIFGKHFFKMRWTARDK